jgi:hypothetical protein
VINQQDDSNLVTRYHREFQDMIAVVHSLPSRSAFLAERLRFHAPASVRGSATTNLFEFELDSKLVMEFVLEILDFDPEQGSIQQEFGVSEQAFLDAADRLASHVSRARQLMNRIGTSSPRLALKLVNSPIPKPMPVDER